MCQIKSLKFARVGLSLLLTLSGGAALADNAHMSDPAHQAVSTSSSTALQQRAQQLNHLLNQNNTQATLSSKQKAALEQHLAIRAKLNADGRAS